MSRRRSFNTALGAFRNRQIRRDIRLNNRRPSYPAPVHITPILKLSETQNNILGIISLCLIIIGVLGMIFQH
jgi:hypothetical protein